MASIKEDQLPKICLEQKLTSKDPITQNLIGHGITDFGSLLSYTRAIPYGRTADRRDLGLVVSENKGTCSSKHALVKMLADLNDFTNVQLILCLFKMNKQNTPGIGNVLSDHQIPYLPEAHCYLQVLDKKIDLTSSDSELSKIEQDILQELPIDPEQIAEFKVDFHKAYLEDWIIQQKMNKNFETIWIIREACIEALSIE